MRWKRGQEKKRVSGLTGLDDGRKMLPDAEHAVMNDPRLSTVQSFLQSREESARARLSAARAKIAEAEKEAAEASSDLAELKRIYAFLIHSSRSDTGAESEVSFGFSPPQVETGVTTVSSPRHADVAMQILREEGKPLTAAQIVAIMVERGHQLPSDPHIRHSAIYSALQRRKSVFIRIERGKWGLVGRDNLATQASSAYPEFGFDGEDDEFDDAQFDDDASPEAPSLEQRHPDNQPIEMPQNTTDDSHPEQFRVGRP